MHASKHARTNSSSLTNACTLHRCSSPLLDASPVRGKTRDIRDIYNPKGFQLAHQMQMRTYVLAPSTLSIEGVAP